jgi:hypothetical protein
MMIVNVPSSLRRSSQATQKRRRPSVNDILRTAYKKHGRSRLTLAAVKRFIG